MGKRKGKCVRKNPVTKEALEPEHLVKAPHSYVIHRGHCSKNVMDLAKDFRKVMEPFTASQLNTCKTIKDLVAVSGYFHVSHMAKFTETELGTYMRLMRLPRGPTLTFRIHNFSLARDVVSSLRKQYVMMKAFQNPPLIVLNSFSGEGMHMKLMATMFQNMFPTINITNVKLKNIRRCVCMNYNPLTKLIDFRHYVIRATPVGLNRSTRKMVQGKIPNLSRCRDMAEFYEKAGMLSESEFEDDPSSQIVLPQNLANRGAAAGSKSSVKLYELGPRITMQLMKVEDGLEDGEVLFHELIEKSEEEKAVIKKRREEKRRLKEKRKQQQEENIKKKEIEKDALKQKALEGIKKKKEMTENERLIQLAAAESQSNDAADDDAEYYRKEVGEEPEADLFSEIPLKRKLSNYPTNQQNKKVKLDSKLKKKYLKSQEGGNKKVKDRANNVNMKNDGRKNTRRTNTRNDRGTRGPRVVTKKFTKFKKSNSGKSKGRRGKSNK